MNLFVSLLACASTSTPVTLERVAQPTPDQPDIVLLVTSGLRADPAGTDGAEAEFAAGLGLDARRYTNAYAQSASAFVSTGSLMTGRYATSLPLCGLFTTGVDGVMSAHVQPNAVQDRAWCAQLPHGTHTLPEVLGIYGYETALLSVGLTGIELVAPGFGTVVAIPEAPTGGTDWTALSAAATGWWSEHTNAPRLLVVQTSDLQVVQRPELMAAMGIGLAHEAAEAIGEAKLAATDAGLTESVYRREAKIVGARFGELAASLGSARARWVVATSTNGMSLLEPGGFADMAVPAFTTSYSLDRIVHVPLLVSGPAMRGGTDERIVQLTDLLPTFAEVGHAVAPADAIGRSLLAPEGDGYAYSEFGDTLLLREGAYVLVFRGFLHHGTMIDPQLDERMTDVRARDDPKFFTMHEITRDPWQTENLRFRDAERFHTLMEHMVRIRKGVAAPPADTWSDPHRLWEVRMARSQGYW